MSNQNQNQSLKTIIEEKSSFNIGDKVIWKSKQGNRYKGKITELVVNGDVSDPKPLIRAVFDATEDSSFTVTDTEDSFYHVDDVPDFKNTYVALVLDESGSMSTIEKEIVEGFNEQIQSIKRGHKEGNTENTYISLVTFDSGIYEKWFNKGIDDIESLDKDDYNPGSMTAMLDAVGYTLDKLKDKTNYDSDDNKYLVVVLSDGKENNSTDYGFDDIAELVSDLQDNYNFTFTYMGANQDLSELSDKLNIKEGNITGFESTKEGTQVATCTMGVATASYFARGEAQADNFYVDSDDGVSDDEEDN